MKERKRLVLPSKQERHRLFGSITPGPKTKPTEKKDMPDLQNAKKDFIFEIDAVGISNVKHPVTVNSNLAPFEQTTVANFTFTSKVPSNQKGTNMSRFTEQLQQYYSKGFSVSITELYDFARELATRLEQDNAVLEMTFPWFYERKGPASGISGLNHAEAYIKVEFDVNNGYSSEVGLTCAVTTLCPCSKEISEYSAHNQRGYIKMTTEVDEDLLGDVDWKEALLHAAESNASAMIHPVLKRPDEKMVTETAYENPRFVEDMVRLVAADLYELQFVTAFTVECRNEESIHLHDAIASLSFRK
ncbi:GTP cyclohydrolase FolE2 [Bacillus salitolerans]|uniref:GTP cyclohydrolase FolE2 n=1 Tax=Bacillus salitolerans TaxID=1437434 RepID=A0ABW4LVR4_9BACI